MRGLLCLAQASVACGLVLAGCLPAGEPTDVVAYVGGRPVAFQEFESFVSANAGAEWPVLEEEVLAPLFDQFLDELLLARLARDRGLVEASAGRLEALRALRRVAAPAPVDAQEIRAYLEAHPAVRVRPERLTLGQLLIEDREVAERARHELRRGRPFDIVAEELAVLPGVVYGGYVQDVTRSDLPVAFRERLFSLPAGEVSDILEAQYGYHIFHVRERRPDETLSSSEAAVAVHRELSRQRADEGMAGLLEEARGLYSVEVLEGNLPFHWGVAMDPYRVTP